MWDQPLAGTLFTMKGQVALGTGLVSVNWTITNIFWFNYLTLVDLIRRMLNLKEVRESHDTGCRRSVLKYKPKSLPQVTSNCWYMTSTACMTSNQEDETGGLFLRLH